MNFFEKIYSRLFHPEETDLDQVRYAAESSCDPKIYAKGSIVVDDAPHLSACLAEAWCAWAEKRTGVVIDWHYIGGRCIFLSITDDIAATQKRISPCLPMLKRMQDGETEFWHSGTS